MFFAYSPAYFFCAYFAYWWAVCILCRLCILICILLDIWFAIFFIFIFIITYSASYSFYLTHILHILHMHKERFLASGVSFFALAMLQVIAWSPMTGPSCSHTTTDIRLGRLVSYHNLRPVSPLIPLASGRGSLQYCPPGQEEAAPVWRTLEQHTRLELIHGAHRRWLTGWHLPIL